MYTRSSVWYTARRSSCPFVALVSVWAGAVLLASDLASLSLFSAVNSRRSFLLRRRLVLPFSFWRAAKCSSSGRRLVHPSSSSCLTGPGFTTQIRGPISGPCSAGSCLWGSEQRRVWRRRTIPARALVTVSPVKAETVQRSKTQVVEKRDGTRSRRISTRKARLRDFRRPN